MIRASDAYTAAERDMGIPPVARRGRTDENPKGIGFWALVVEDFATHEHKFFEQGFWAIFWHRFGNWRMGQPKIVRAPATLLYNVMFKLIEWFCGISLWYTVKLGRRVRIWHHSGMSLGARAIGDDVQIRQNTTLGVARTGQNDQLPIIGTGVDIGAGACVAGAVYVGRDAKIGAGALILTDIPDGATAMGNPAMVYNASATDTAVEAGPGPQSLGASATTTSAVTAPAPSEITEKPLEEVRDLGVIALLGSANLDYLAADLKSEAERFAIAIDTYVPPFGQARMKLLQPAGNSELKRSLADCSAATLIVERAEDLLGEAYRSPLSLALEDRDDYLAAALEPMLDLVRDAREHLSGPIFVLSLGVMGRSSLGLADAGAEQGLAALVAAANAHLSKAAAELSDTHLIDTGDLIAETGREAAEPGQFWHLGRVPFSTALNARLSRRVLGGLLATRGATARILVLDLDNTLWGGVLGEDGIEGVAVGPSAYPGSAYTAFQEALRALTRRGIALAVASKNDADLALKMIEEHPEMTLRESDLVSHRIGWSEKSHGIQDMLDEVGLGAANAMFIDDNPVEREKARKNVPGLIVPPFPDAPEDLAGWLLDNPFLETLSLTASDLKRTAQYKVRAREVSAKRQFQNIEDFYRDLDMTLTIESYGPSNQQRVLQLFVKTNQFNATLRRHDAKSVQSILEGGGEVFAVGVADRHSPYELMGVLVLRPDAAMQAAYPDDPAIVAAAEDGAWWVDNILLSCRILGRTVETAIIAWAADHVVQKDATALLGEVIEAPRNTPVRDLFAKSGMAPVETGLDLGAGGIWRQDLSGEVPQVPDYFTVTDTPPAALQDEATAPKPEALGRAAPLRMPQAASEPAPSANTAPAVTLDPETERRLAATFKQVFGLPADHDPSGDSMDNVAAWDSLGHLRLAMELERQMGLRLAGTELSRLNSYAGIRAAAAENLART
ncbi:HAD-IIIC family phosphatase [uncultured Jannaschia sp.]|uniref:HAD-IIIC family phosphatase n=1 Tax=uncultured Jannaschia sp. TaxID=293347 RepID=UPI002633835A|nr:HAD-IIIC family phosphatase [uncultured Jannaschia sp.]